MPEEFYTLEQAAARLGVPPERLRQMAQRKEIRVFVDRGNWRFRASEIEELRRHLGVGSSSEIAATGPRTPKPSGPDSGPRTPKRGQEASVPSDPESGDALDLVSLFAQGPRAQGSDSEVRLVPEGSDISLVVLPPEPEKPSSHPTKEKSKPESQVRLEQAQAPGEAARPRLSQLGVRPAEPDSDVWLLDIKARQVIQPAPAARQDTQLRLEPDRRSNLKPNSGLQAEQHSPGVLDPAFPLAANRDEELQQIEAGERSVENSKQEGTSVEMLQNEAERTEFEGQGSEFELTLAGEEAALPSESASETFRIKDEDEDASRGPGVDSSSNQPLALEAGEGSATESFELSLDEEGAEAPPRSESARHTPDSSSEFELVIQEDEDSEADTHLLSVTGGQASYSLQEADANEEISDFDLTVEEVGEEAPAIDGESDRDTEVVLDEDAKADEETIMLESDRIEDLSDLSFDSQGFEELGSSEVWVQEAEEEKPELAAEALPEPRILEVRSADWGMWALVHVPTTLVLVFAGLLMFELVRSVLYYHEPGMMGGQIFEMLSNLFRK
jgi:excisionase family DNA binding protein